MGGTGSVSEHCANVKELGFKLMKHRCDCQSCLSEGLPQATQSEQLYKMMHT